MEPLAGFNPDRFLLPPMMHRSSWLLCVAALATAALVLSLSPLSLVPRGLGSEIRWEPNVADALTEAKQTQRVVFIAINMDGDPGNDRMAEGVYRDKTILRLTAQTLNLVGSLDWHNRSGPCRRLGPIACSEHQAVEKEVRTRFLQEDADGHVVAPQHLWIGPDGEVLLSVPYEVTAGELEWCFHRAWSKVDPDYSGQPSKASRMPRRFIDGGVFDPQTDAEDPPPSREEVLAIIAELRKGSLTRRDVLERLRQLVRSEEPEAMKEIEQYLKGGGSTGRGAGRGGRGGNQNPLSPLLRAIGDTAPATYHRLVVDLIQKGDLATRSEAAVALEQLADPGALTALLKELKKAKDPTLKKNLVRAIGTCAGDHATARKALLKASRDRKDANLRRNALIALGTLSVNPKTMDRLIEALEDPELAPAAALGLALTRDERAIEPLEARIAQRAEEKAESQPTDEEVEEPTPDRNRPQDRARNRGQRNQDRQANPSDPFEAALQFLQDGDYSGLRTPIERVSGDTIPRNRLYPRRERPDSTEDSGR